MLANADKTELYSLSRNWSDLVARSRTKQLKPEEYSTGTFTGPTVGSGTAVSASPACFDLFADDSAESCTQEDRILGLCG